MDTQLPNVSTLRQWKRSRSVGSSTPGPSPSPSTASATTQSKRMRQDPSPYEFSEVSDSLKHQVCQELDERTEMSVAVMRVAAATLNALHHNKNARVVDPLWLTSDYASLFPNQLGDAQSGTCFFAPCHCKFDSGWSLCCIAVTDSHINCTLYDSSATDFRTTRVKKKLERWTQRFYPEKTLAFRQPEVPQHDYGIDSGAFTLAFLRQILQSKPVPSTIDPIEERSILLATLENHAQNTHSDPLYGQEEADQSLCCDVPNDDNLYELYDHPKTPSAGENTEIGQNDDDELSETSTDGLSETIAEELIAITSIDMIEQKMSDVQQEIELLGKDLDEVVKRGNHIASLHAPVGEFCNRLQTHMKVAARSYQPLLEAQAAEETGSIEQTEAQLSALRKAAETGFTACVDAIEAAYEESVWEWVRQVEKVKQETLLKRLDLLEGLHVLKAWMRILDMKQSEADVSSVVGE